MILKNTATFQVLFIVSLFWSWNITTVEINSGVQLTQKLNPPSAFVYFRWSWSWSCYFGLGLTNLILVTSLLYTATNRKRRLLSGLFLNETVYFLYFHRLSN